MDLFSYLLGKKSGGGSGGQHIQYDTIPEASESNLGKVIQYTGETDANYTNGYFYTCISDEEETPTYSWVQINVQPETDLSNYQTKIQYSIMPVASADNLGQIIQYVGTTSGNNVNGYFYICVSDNEETPTYSWSKLNVFTMNVTYTDTTTATFEIIGREIV